MNKRERRRLRREQRRGTASISHAGHSPLIGLPSIRGVVEDAEKRIGKASFMSEMANDNKDKDDENVVGLSMATTDDEFDAQDEKVEAAYKLIYSDAKHLTSDQLELCTMLTYCRPDGSKAERRFIRRFLKVLPGYTQDSFGNIIVTIPRKDGSRSPFLFSAHTDTVHRVGGRQIIQVTKGHHVELATRAGGSNCLGGDNTVGVWLLVNMIRSGVPGMYVFHRGEERGCRGSKFIAQKTAFKVEGIDYAIAFDRRGTRSIITHQMGSRTASDAFCGKLRDALNLGHELDDGGLYTDTNSYAGLVAECTNISAGFSGEHSAWETVDLIYALRLMRAVTQLDWDAAGFKPYRDPSLPDYGFGYSRYPYSYSSWGGTGRSSSNTTRNADSWDDYLTQRYGTATGGVNSDDDPNGPYPGDDDVPWDDNYGNHVGYKSSKSADYDEMLRLIKQWPEAVADLLKEWGLSSADITAHLGMD